jgi:hypothetical protein
MNGFFFPLLIAAVVSLASPEARSTVMLELLSVSRIKNGPDESDRLFKPLDTVWINMRIIGLVQNDRSEVVFQADIRLLREDGSTVMEKQNIIDQSISASSIEKPELNMTFNVDLYESIAPGRYSTIITVRDVTSQKTGTCTIRFVVQK